MDLLPLLSAEVTVLNLTDDLLTLTVTIVDTDSPDEFEIGTIELAPSQVTTQSIVPTRFRLDFGFRDEASAQDGTCTLDVAEGEAIQFAVVPTGIAITTNGDEPDDPEEMVVATASRCHVGAES